MVERPLSLSVVVDKHFREVDDFSTYRPYEFNLEEHGISLEQHYLNSYTLELRVFIDFKCKEEQLREATKTARSALLRKLYQNILADVNELERIALYGGSRVELSEIVSRIKDQITQ